MEKLIIIDGNSIINRAYYAIRPLSTKTQIPTNGIFGFMNIMLKNISEQNPDYLFVAFDLKAPTFRHKMYEKYKAQRKGMPDDLRVQMPHLKELLTYMNIPILEKEGFEADDIIGTVSKICDDMGILCKIVTGDKDDLQLASKTTNVLLTVTKMGQTVFEELDENGVFEKYGVSPQEFLQVKALMGDSSDNIPGVSGIGEKTAFSLIKEYHSLDNIYENLEKITPKGVHDKLQNGKDDAYMSLTLSTIVRDVDVLLDFEKARLGDYQNENLIKKLEELEMQKIAERLNLETKKNIPDKKEVLEASETDITGISSPFSFLISDGYVLFDGKEQTFKTECEKLKAVFENEKIIKITHDFKSVLHFLDKRGISVIGDVFDTQIAGYILESSRKSYDFKSLCDENLLPAEPSSLIKLKDLQQSLIKEHGEENVLYNIEFPLTRVLFSMEKEGFMADKDALFDFSKLLGERLFELEEQIYFTAGEKININSPKQLSHLLFETLMLPVVKKTKSGASTDSDVLEKLRTKHPVVDLIIEYRHLSKLKSTYADGLLPMIKEDGRIHSTLNQTVTTTGRISSTEPNLQNIPVRTPLGRELRKMFVAKEGFVLIDADYSQIELRVLSDMANDEKMCDAFLNGEDIHLKTASKIFGTSEFLVTPEMRSRAKTVNFGVIYGQSEFSLANDLKISRKEAKKYIDSYFENYQGVRSYMEKAVLSAKEQGYITTVFGRRRYIPEIMSTNFNLRSFGERVARNAPIQGTAADIIKIAMVNVYRRLNKECKNSRLIMQVHDELIIEAIESEKDLASKILKEEMENAVKLKVPLLSEVNCGKSWYDAK